MLGLVVIGVASLFVGIETERRLAGLSVYALTALATLALTLYGQASDRVTMLDERDRRLHERASHTVVSVVSYAGLPAVVALYLLDATGRYIIGPTVWGVIYGFSAFYLVWGVVYLYHRSRS